MDLEITRTFMLQLLMVQTSFRQAIQKSMKRHNIELTFEMLQIMVYLWKKDGVNQQELASNTFKDKASLTSLLRNLEVKNLVSRRSDHPDRRNKNVYLTPQGLACGERVKPILNEIYAAAGNQVNRTETESCILYLQKLNDVFKGM